MKRLFKGGTVVSGDGMRKVDLLVKGEKILAVGENLEFRDAEIVDVSGKLLFPGFIGAHTHMALEVSGTITADKFETGTKAELAGGTTCIVDYATQYKGESLREALDNWHEKADGESSCDYAFHLALTDWNEEISRELEEAITAREGKCVNANEKGKIPVVENQKEINCAQTIQPIICAGDAIGAVILMGKNEKDVFGNSERMLVQTAAGFLGRQMEQ